jgi:hypothetical protein
MINQGALNSNSFLSTPLDVVRLIVLERRGYVHMDKLAPIRGAL